MMFNAFRAGGSQTYAVELASRLKREGFRTLAMAKRGTGMPAFARVGADCRTVCWREGDAIACSAPAWRSVAATVATCASLPLVVETARKLHPAAIVASQPWPQFYATLVAKLLQPRPLLFALYHGYTAVEMPPAGGARTITRFDAHYTSTVEAATHLKALYGVSATTLGNLFDAGHYWGRQDPWQVPRPTQERQLVAIATLTPNKVPAIELAITWLAKRDWTLTIIGDGPSRNRLEAAATAAGVRDRVLFTGGLADPRSELEKASVVLAVGRAAMEAASRGIPVVIGASRGIAGPLTADNFHAFEAVNFTDRITDHQPLTTMSFDERIVRALALSQDERNQAAEAFASIGNIGTLLLKLRRRVGSGGHVL